MEKKSTQPFSRRKKILLTVLGSLLLLAAIFPLLLNAVIKNQLPNYVNSKTAYQISLQDFDINLYRGNIEAKNVLIKTKPTNDASVTQINGKLSSVKITDFGVWNAVLGRSYTASDIILDSANLKIALGKKKKDSTKKKSVDFGAENILINNSNFAVTDANKKSLFNGNNVNLKLTEISQTKDVSKIPVAFKEFKIDAQDVVITANEFYQILAKNISAKNKQLHITDFHLKPVESPKLYNAKSVYDLKVAQLDAQNFVVDKDSLMIQKASFTKPALIITSTNKKVVKQNPKEINLKIDIKDLDLKNGSVLVQNQNKQRTAAVDHFRLNLTEVVFDKNTVKQKIPFKFSSHDIELQNVYALTDPLQAATVKRISSNSSDIVIENAEYKALGRSATKSLINLMSDKILILNNKSKFVGQQYRLDIKAINIFRPKIQMIAATAKNKTSKKANANPADLTGKIGAVNIINGTFTQNSAGRDKLSVGTFNVQLNNLTTDKNQLQQSVPFKIGRQLITAKSIDWDAGKFYRLKIGDVKNTGKNTRLSNFSFLPKYSREQFNRMIAVEEDLYTLRAKSIDISDKNSVLGKNMRLNLDKIIFEGIDANIFHDLTPADDNKLRTMFGEKLRSVKFPLFVNLVEIRKSKLVYEEKTEKAQIPGKILFEDFNAKIRDVNSAKMPGKPTKVKVDANFQFFGDAPSVAKWEFDVANKMDAYTIAATINNLSVENANLFVRPYLNVTLDGKIHYLKFDYAGDKTKIGGNFYFKYSDMSINFLNKETGEEKKLLSGIANLLVKNNSQGEPDHVEVDKERDPKKSFFNMLWQGVMEGLKKYII